MVAPVLSVGLRKLKPQTEETLTTHTHTSKGAIGRHVYNTALSSIAKKYHKDKFKAKFKTFNWQCINTLKE